MKKYLLDLFKKKRIRYIVENADWSIKWDGIYISQNIQKLYNADIDIAINFKRIKRKVIHFGTKYIYLSSGWKTVHSSNRVIFTWFHGRENDLPPALIECLPEASKRADLVHTSCTLSRDRLIKWGVDRDKLVMIPLGVDLSLFNPLKDQNKKRIIKQEIGIPEGKICIGSFQKDGNGWGEGNEPKLIKGPDIFCDAVIELSKMYPIHVLLTGPARGYVKNRLSKAEIPFTHIYLKNYLDIAKYYLALDLYLITSREEGGPKATVESMATGVPLVSTKVGMANDVIVHGENGFLADVEDTQQLVNYSSLLIENNALRQRLTKSGLETVKNYDWEIIAGRYYEKLYLPLLADKDVQAN